MEWFADFARVSFGGIEKVFDVSSVFCEFNIGGNFVQIKWYGVIIAFGFILAALFGGRIAYTWRIDLSKMVDVLIYGTFGGIIGARAYYVIFEWDYYRLNPAEIFQIWNGGLAIYGGIIGGLIAAFITCKIEKLNFMNLLDLVGMSLLIGQGIGRWGNYANQEAFGTFTNGNYGMMSKKVAAYVAMNPDKFGLEGVYDIPEYIAENNCRIKYDVVMKDERESGLREILNLGHTVGRAIETVSDYQLLHGEAVSIGLVAQAMLSARLGYMSEEQENRVINLLKLAGLPVEIPEYIDRELLVKKLYTDKKVRDGKLRFVIEKGIGEVVEFAPGVYAKPIEEDVAREIIMEM